MYMRNKYLGADHLEQQFVWNFPICLLCACSHLVVMASAIIISFICVLYLSSLVDGQICSGCGFIPLTIIEPSGNYSQKFTHHGSSTSGISLIDLQLSANASIDLPAR